MQEVITASLERLGEYRDKMREILADLRAKNDKGTKIEPWKEDQLKRFGEILAQNASELARAFKEGNPSKTAWVARNLLELSVWVRYCNLSDAHGKRFRVDGGKDLVGLFEAFKQLHFDRIKNDIPRMAKARQEMETVLQQEFGISSLDTKYLRVADAAGEVGEKDFEGLNKLLSKYAHPTAWVVATTHFEEFENFGVMFLIEGTSFALVALDEIKTHVQKHYPMMAEVKNT